MKLEQIKPYPKNAKKHPQTQIKQVAESIKEFGFNQPIVVDKENVIIVGHGRYEAAKLLGLKEVPCKVIDIPKEKANAYRLADNKLNESDWDMDLAVEELKGLSDEMFDLTGFDKDLLIEFDNENSNKLVDIFLAPPFSVLDTKQEYWQERKRKWLKLGIRSEETRQGMKTTGSLSGTIPGYYSKKEKRERMLGRKLSNKEFEEKFLDDFIKKTTIKFTDTGGILSVFDPVVYEVMYRWFCIGGGKILDPFAGGSVRGIVANYLDYKYTGVDLSENQIRANIENAKEVVPDKIPEWIIGDSKNLDSLVDDNFDFLFSCPPYFNLEVYSEKEGELSNMDWEDFQKNYREIIKKSVDKLKDNSFAVFVVSEVRDKKEGGAYVNFVGETVKSFLEAGMKYYNEIILLNTCGSVPMRITRQFHSFRKIGSVHQNILVFYKGNIENIKEKFGKVDIKTKVDEL